MDNGECQDFAQEEFTALDVCETMEKLEESIIEVPKDF
jgi:hypothetical protein